MVILPLNLFKSWFFILKDLFYFIKDVLDLIWGISEWHSWPSFNGLAVSGRVSHFDLLFVFLLAINNYQIIHILEVERLVSLVKGTVKLSFLIIAYDVVFVYLVQHLVQEYLVCFWAAQWCFAPSLNSWLVLVKTLLYFIYLWLQEILLSAFFIDVNFHSYLVNFLLLQGALRSLNFCFSSFI